MIQLRRSGTLVSAREWLTQTVPDTEAILDQSAVNIRDRGTAWRKAVGRISILKPNRTQRMKSARSESSIELLQTTSLEDLLISDRNFFRSAELIVRKQTELSHGFRKRRIIVVIGHPAPDHYLACSFYASLTTARQMGVAERHPRFPARRAAANIHQQMQISTSKY